MKVKYTGPRRHMRAHNIVFMRNEAQDVPFNVGRRVIRNRYFEEVAENKPLIKMSKDELKEKLTSLGIEFNQDAKRPELMRLASGN